MKQNKKHQSVNVSPFCLRFFLNKMLVYLRFFLNKLLEWVCSLLLVFMVGLSMLQIIGRYCFKNSLPFSESLLTFSFVWLVLLASAYGFGKKSHLSMSFLREKWERHSPALQLAFSVGNELLVMAFALVVLGVGGIQITRLTLTQEIPDLGLPMGVNYVALPISGLLIVLYGLCNLADAVSRFRQSKSASAEAALPLPASDPPHSPSGTPAAPAEFRQTQSAVSPPPFPSSRDSSNSPSEAE